MRLRGRARKDGIGKDGDWEEAVIGTGGGVLVAAGGLGRGGAGGRMLVAVGRFGRGWLVEVISEGGERDVALATEVGLRQAAPAEIVDDGVPA